MIAGLPGTGIGGVFYLLSALLMPCRELIHNLQPKKRGRKRKNQWRLVSRQIALALAILGGFRLTELMLTFIIHHIIQRSAQAKTIAQGFSVYQVKPVALSLLVLLAVLLSVYFLKALTPQRGNLRQRPIQQRPS